MKQPKFLLLIVLSFFLLHHTLNAQIVYTDVVPDTTVNEFLQGYGIDFNHDDKIDVHLTLLDNVGVWVMLLIPDSELDEVSVVYDGEEASILELGNFISPTSDYWELGSGWGGLLYGYWDGDGAYGNWVDTQLDKYLGIKFSHNSSFHYAWIHLSTDIHAYDDYEFTIHGFAYNSTAEEGIEAGDMGTGVGITEAHNKSFILYPNPVQDILSFQGDENIERYWLTDVFGRIVIQESSSKNVKIDVSGLANGYYFLNIGFNNKQSERQSFIKQ